MAVPCIANTCSLDLSLDGGNNLVGDVNLDPDGGIQCLGLDGLSVLLDPDACNPLTVGAAGLLAPYDHDSTLLSEDTTVGNASAGVTIGIGGVSIDADVFAAAYTTTLREITTRSSITYTNNTCRTVNFTAQWIMGPQSYALVNGWWFAVGTRNQIATPHIAATVFPSTFYNSSSSPFTGTGTSLGLAMPPAIYEIESYLAPGEAATATVSLFAQAVTVGPSSTNPFNENTAGIYFGQRVNFYAWTT